MPGLPGVKNVLKQPLYDTVQVAAATGQVLKFFSVPLNGIIAGTTKKTHSHTNLVQTGQLPADVSFVGNFIALAVREKAVGGAAPTLADVTAIRMGHLEIKIGGREVGYFPASRVPAGGMELMYFSNITPAVTEYHVNQGVSAVTNQLPIDPAIEIGPGEPIVVSLAVEEQVVAVTDVMFMFIGRMSRPVG